MANVIAFYGHRQAYGLSVSPNPLTRNPSYTAIENADLQLRDGAIQYVVWDSFSAARSRSFSNRLQAYVTRSTTALSSIPRRLKSTTASGSTTVRPLIIIYELRP